MKRILLALVFVAALGAAGFGTSNTAKADHWCYGDYGWYGHRAYYPAYYYDYGPQFSFYRSYGRPYGHHRHHHHHHGHHRHGHSGFSFSIGF